MTKKMLIDAVHPEETRVAIVSNNNKLIDYDFESASKKNLKGNVYLAKIARVEPSLQAAFVDYGEGRHGFLAFNEIHPDYFRIPISDRHPTETKELQKENQDSSPEGNLNSQETDEDSLDNLDSQGSEDRPSPSVNSPTSHQDSSSEDAPRSQPHFHRLYKIQEVIKKNQIVLVQVAKEERGTKGAALTTYISIAGRYSVLMPNSDNSGGISRKIANPSDRKRLREILDTLNTPPSMGLIIRTAGIERTKAEIKRDAEYLMRLWNDIRSSTLESIAPCLVYQEDDIIKRAIRDLYSKEVEEILVEGENGYKTAKAFMKTLLPSHTKRVKLYKNDRMPLFYQARIEKQIDDMHSPMVRLPSGGSIVIHPTEALVSIDINSGRSTKERHIEETALKTNLEAADEIYRQVRLRDLAGLIVIDFIDMDNQKNAALVEKKVRDVFRNDRARIQIGKISSFGLLELSRQRLKPSIIETASIPCPHCRATGHIRSTESVALMILRVLEEEGYTQKYKKILIKLSLNVSLYILNNKRQQLVEIENRHRIQVHIEGDPHIVTHDYELTPLEMAEEQPSVAPIPEEVVTTEQKPTPSAPKEPYSQEKSNFDKKNKRRRKRNFPKTKGQEENPDTGEKSFDTEDSEEQPYVPSQPSFKDSSAPAEEEEITDEVNGNTFESNTSSSPFQDKENRPNRRRFKHRKRRPNTPTRNDTGLQNDNFHSANVPAQEGSNQGGEESSSPGNTLEENTSDNPLKKKSRRKWWKRLIDS